jgi:hypothetical protein
MRIGTKEFDAGLTKLWNSLGNKLIKEMSTEDEDYVFTVTSRKSSREPANKDGYRYYEEPSDWMIEVDSDRQIPSSFKFNPDYQRVSVDVNDFGGTYAKNFHPNLITHEMREYLKYLGHDTSGPGESINMVFTNSEEWDARKPPNLRDF